MPHIRKLVIHFQNGASISPKKWWGKQHSKSHVDGIVDVFAFSLKNIIQNKFAKCKHKMAWTKIFLLLNSCVFGSLAINFPFCLTTKNSIKKKEKNPLTKHYALGDIHYFRQGIHTKHKWFQNKFLKLKSLLKIYLKLNKR